MRILPLALVPAALLLAGGAPATPSAQELIECSVPRDDALLAIKDFRLEGANESKPGANRYYMLPDGVTVFGFPARTFASNESVTAEAEAFSLMAIVSGPYDQVVAAALKQKHLAQCESKGEGEQASCIAVLRTEGKRVVALAFRKYRSETIVSCGYVRLLR